MIATLQSKLQQYGAQPDFWAKDMAIRLQALRQSLQDSPPVVPSDLQEALGGHADGLLQRLVGQYGQLLRHWPDIVESAKELRRQGQPLAQRIAP